MIMITSSLLIAVFILWVFQGHGFFSTKNTYRIIFGLLFSVVICLALYPGNTSVSTLILSLILIITAMAGLSVPRVFLLKLVFLAVLATFVSHMLIFPIMAAYFSRAIYILLVLIVVKELLYDKITS